MGNILEKKLYDLEAWIINTGFFNLPTYKKKKKTDYNEFVVFYSLSL